MSHPGTLGGGVPPHLSQDEKLDWEQKRKKQKRWRQKETSLDPTGGSCSSFASRLPASCFQFPALSVQGRGVGDREGGGVGGWGAPPKGTKRFSQWGKKASESNFLSFPVFLIPPLCSLFSPI